MTIALVDDHPVFLSGLKALLQSEQYTVGIEAGSAETFLEMVSLQPLPQVVMADIGLPGMSGTELCKELKSRWPQVKLVALSSHADPRIVRQMIKNGAHGYLLKTVEANELFECLRCIEKGETYIQHALRQTLLDHSLGKTVKEKSPLPKLTPREKDILALIVAGDTTAVIAEKLFVTTATVETHRMNLFLKLNVKNVAGLVREALQNNLLD